MHFKMLVIVLVHYRCLMFHYTVVDMAPYYEIVCKELGWTVDEKLLQVMKSENEERIKQLDEKVKDAEENLGETEVRAAMTAKAHYLSKIGNKVQLFAFTFLTALLIFVHRRQL